MKLEIIFNDLSIQPTSSVDQACSWLTEMMTTIADLIDRDVCVRTLHTNIDFYDIELIGNSFGYQEWLDKTLKTDRELFEFALQLSTQSPASGCLSKQQAIHDEYLLSEFFLKDTTIKCDALGAALLADGLAISLPSMPQWQIDSIDIEQRSYDENLDDSQRIFHQLSHASLGCHVEGIIKRLHNELLDQIDSSDKLLIHWTDAFPNLDRCEEISLLNLQGITLESVIRRLNELNNACCGWKANNKLAYPMSTRPESKATMQQETLAAQRLFTCPYQGKQHFIMHCNIQPKGFRLYWFENQPLKRITIGYIGSHLQTAKHKPQ